MINKLNKNSESTLKARYYNNEKETWPLLGARVVDNVVVPSMNMYDYTEEEKKYYRDEIFSMINETRFMPNSPTLFNAGTKNPMLSACFIIDVEDSMEKIFESIKDSAMIHKFGGGVGASFHKLRVKGSKIDTTHGVSSGSCSFIYSFSDSTKCVTAGGRRKGANMAQQSIYHGDIEEFIDLKTEEGKLENFNISITVPNSFITAVRDNREVYLIDPKDDSRTKSVSAKELLHKVAVNAHKNGEPGITFIDVVNEDNACPHLGRIHGSNPCGEFYNIPYSSCNLGSLNLSLYVNEDKSLDWSLLEKHIKLSTFFLDCIIDVNKYPLPIIDETTKKIRPIGLGVLGFADMLIKMGLRYDSDESFSLAEKISEFITFHSMLESVDLSKKRGRYPEFRVENHKCEKYIKSGTLDWKGLVKKIKKDGLRHSHNSLIAPTGSIARIANEASFGIEPVFAFSYDSNILDGKKQTFNHPLYQAFLDNKLDVPKDTFVCAKDIKWEDHIKMVAAWQKFVHNGISKTINMPKSATVDDVLNAYMMAYDMGLKGITIYREGSREKEVLVSSDADKSDKKPGRRIKEIDQKLLAKLITEKRMSAAELSDLFDCSISTIRKRVKELGLITQLVPEKIKCPDELDATRYKVETPAGTLYIEVGRDAETRYPIETILNISKSGSSVNAVAEALGKMVSKALQHRMDPYEVIETLKNILGGDSVSWWRGKPVKSIPDALAKVLETYMKEHVNGSKEDVVDIFEDTCPVCGEKRIIQEGCSSCGCGSKCG